MRIRWPVIAAFVGLGAAWLVYPYATLWRLDIAVRQADAAPLRSLVDWDAVRDGLKEELSDWVLDEPANGRPSNELAPFGAGFVRGVTGRALDLKVTPETLMSLVHAASDTPRADPPIDAYVEWACFTNPTIFSVRVRTDIDAEPIRVVMELRGWRWKVRRVWLPHALLRRAGSGT